MDRCRLKDEVYLAMAVDLSHLSTCLDKHVGCILVDSSYKVLATGYNGAPSGVSHCNDIGRCIKLLEVNPNACLSAHAEQNALVQCTRPDLIFTCYTTLSPCTTCIKMLMNTSCHRIVFIKEHRHPEARSMWLERGGDWIGI